MVMIAIIIAYLIFMANESYHKIEEVEKHLTKNFDSSAPPQSHCRP